MGALDFKLYHGLSRGLFLSLFIRADDVNDDMTVGTFQHYRTNTNALRIRKVTSTCRRACPRVNTSPCLSPDDRFSSRGGSVHVHHRLDDIAQPSVRALII